MTTDIQRAVSESQMYTVLAYWAFLLVSVNGGRLFIIGIEKLFGILEYVPKRTLIIGCNEQSERAVRDINSNPHLIYDIVGFVCDRNNSDHFMDYPVFNSYLDLPFLIHQHRIEEIIVAIEDSATKDFLQVITLCEKQRVTLKMLQGSSGIFGSQHGKWVEHTFARIFPENMVLWQWMVKRILDLAVSTLLLIISAPIFLLLMIYSKIRFNKSIFLKIPIVGKNGILFHMLVFRITPNDFDYETNSLYIGQKSYLAKLSGLPRILYRLRFYKLPQLINVFWGDMSLIGPRPEPIEWYTQNRGKLGIIFYRLGVRPGLTGLTQAKYRFEFSARFAEERIKSDFFYIDHMSLRLDLRIWLLTGLFMLKGPAKYEADMDMSYSVHHDKIKDKNA